jgi:hypothetical protein
MPDPTLLGIGFTERSSAVAEFANLRSKHVSGSEVAVPPDQEMVVLPVRRSADELPLPEVPIELLDGNTIRLPISRSLPVTQHRYLASVDVVQSDALFVPCALRTVTWISLNVILLVASTSSSIHIRLFFLCPFFLCLLSAWLLLPGWTNNLGDTRDCS